MTFQCETCKRMFEQTWFDVARSYERVQFQNTEGHDVVEIVSAEGIAAFCAATLNRPGFPRHL